VTPCEEAPRETQEATVMGFIQSDGSVVADRPVRYQTRTSVTSAAAPATVYDTIADLRNHLEWSGARAKDDTFKLLDLNAPPGRAVVGTTFSSTGANYNGTFHDRSTATEATRPTTFVIETEAPRPTSRTPMGRALHPPV
jgi:hypothetical protein